MFSHHTLNFLKQVERILVIHLHHQGHQYLVLTPEIQYRRGSFLIEIEPKLFNLLWQTSSHIELERERQKTNKSWQWWSNVCCKRQLTEYNIFYISKSYELLFSLHYLLTTTDWWFMAPHILPTRISGECRMGVFFSFSVPRRCSPGRGFVALWRILTGVTWHLRLEAV